MSFFLQWIKSCLLLNLEMNKCTHPRSLLELELKRRDQVQMVFTLTSHLPKTLNVTSPQQLSQPFNSLLQNKICLSCLPLALIQFLQTMYLSGNRLINCIWKWHTVSSMLRLVLYLVKWPKIQAKLTYLIYCCNYCTVPNSRNHHRNSLNHYFLNSYDEKNFTWGTW